MIYGFSLGGGVMETNEKVESYGPMEGSGWGFAGQVLVAKELLPDLALGGTLAFQHMSTTRMNAWDTENTAVFGFIGPDLEKLFCSTNCFRIGAASGLALLSAPDGADVLKSIQQYSGLNEWAYIPANENKTSAGIGFDAHLSFDLKVADKWYAGLGFRLLLASLADKKSMAAYGFLVDVINR